MFQLLKMSAWLLQLFGDAVPPIESDSSATTHTQQVGVVLLLERTTPVSVCAVANSGRKDCLSKMKSCNPRLNAVGKLRPCSLNWRQKKDKGTNVIPSEAYINSVHSQ